MKINLTKTTLGTVLAAFHLLALSFHANGQNWQNTEPEGGAWHVAGNWTPKVPSSSVWAVIDNSSLSILSSGTATAYGLRIGAETSGNRVEIANATLSTGTLHLATNNESEGLLHLKEGALLQMTGELLLGDGGNGRLLIDAGATLQSSSTGNHQRMANLATGSANALVRGTWELARGRLDIGFRGKGSLTVGAGGLVNVGTTGTIVLGEQSPTTAFGTLNIGGAVVNGVAGTAEAAGSVNAASLRGGVSGASGGTGVINFNHTSSRHEFSNTEGTAIEINGNVRTSVHLYSGTTVLAADSKYAGGTHVYGGALLAHNDGTGEGSSTGTGALTVHTGGTIGGIGFIAGATTVEGTLAPGDMEEGHGILSFGNHVSLAATSRTVIRASGTERGEEYDSFSVAGTLTLGGTLKAVLEEEFTFSGGETVTLTLFDATAVSGVFAVLDLAETHHGSALAWDTSDLYQTGTLSVAAIPEPQTVALLGGAAVVLFLARHKRKALVS